MFTPVDDLERAIGAKTGIPFSLTTQDALGGGCINQSSRITAADGRTFFLKYNRLSFEPVFRAEASALQAIHQTNTVRVPSPVTVGSSHDTAFLVMEFLPMNGRNSDWNRMGIELARMHRNLSSSFGWSDNNWIGSTPQKNTLCSDWIEFYAQNRLSPQFQLARNNGLNLGKAHALLDSLPAFFDGYQPRPSLLHGDLWAGNASFLDDATPVIFDPAAYYGDREADLAMTELFGGFPPEFYSAYDTEWPIDPGYRLRKDLYNLYHILNHFNLFGGGYGSQAGSIINRLLSRLDN